MSQLDSTVSAEQRLLDHQALIRRLARRCCQRSGLSKEHAEDFSSIVNGKLIADDYRVIREFEGRAKFSSFLTVVVNRCFLDYRNHLWGKWRPSAAAKTGGALAIRLEELILRNEIPASQAIRMMVDNEKVAASQSALETIFEQLPVRTKRRVESDDQLDRMADGNIDAEARLLHQEHQQQHRIAIQILGKILAQLPDEDALILKLLPEHSIAQISRMLHLPQKALYRRRDSLLKIARQKLEAMGVSRQMIFGLLGD